MFCDAAKPPRMKMKSSDNKESARVPQLVLRYGNREYSQFSYVMNMRFYS